MVEKRANAHIEREQNAQFKNHFPAVQSAAVPDVRHTDNADLLMGVGLLCKVQPGQRAEDFDRNNGKNVDFPFGVKYIPSVHVNLLTQRYFYA